MPSSRRKPLKRPPPGVSLVPTNQAFHSRMWHELRIIFDYLSHNSSTRTILLSGAGPKAFTTGLDTFAASQSGVLSHEVATLDPARRATAMRREILEFQDCISSIERCEKPVVCALHGYSLGLAIDISVCADVRFCTKDTKFAVKEVDIGLAADIGTLTRLPKVVGNASWVKDVCLSGRGFSAVEAEKVGFVSWVGNSKEEVIDKALVLCSSVAGKSPVAVQGTKELINYSQDHNTAEGMIFDAPHQLGQEERRDLGLTVLGFRTTIYSYLE